METGLLLIRVVLGGIMMAHGAQKLVGWFGGPGLAGTGGWLEAMGLRPGRMWAALNGLAEFGGGALLVLGLITPLGSAAVAGVMLVAIATVHWRNGFFNTNGGYEFNLLIVATALALAFTGRARSRSTTSPVGRLRDPNGASRLSVSPWSPRIRSRDAQASARAGTRRDVS